MRPILKMIALSSVVMIGGLVLGTPSAKAQGFGYGGYQQGHHGGGYSVPSYSYYGNGGHDAAPHGHASQGLFGSSSYYGTGRHDFGPHGHVQTPYGVTGYSNGLFNSTQSYSPPQPYGYRPW